MSISIGSISTIYRPGAMTSVNKPSSSSTLIDKDIRKLNNDNDILRKELLRKDTRIESLQKEISTIRTSYSNQQRELRLLTSTYEKINNNRNIMINDLTRCKEYINKLELQLTKYSDSVNITIHANTMSNKVDELANELKNCNSIINDKNNYIQSLGIIVIRYFYS